MAPVATAPSAPITIPVSSQVHYTIARRWNKRERKGINTADAGRRTRMGRAPGSAIIQMELRKGKGATVWNTASGGR